MTCFLSSFTLARCSYCSANCGECKKDQQAADGKLEYTHPEKAWRLSSTHTFAPSAAALSGGNDFGIMSFARAFMAETLP